MEILYYSVSKIPSQYANSVNVLKMSSALANAGKKVKLIAENGDNINSHNDIFNQYGINNNFEIELINTKKLGVLKRIIKIFQNLKKYDILYTRYTIAAFIFSFFRKKLIIYEYHCEAYKFLNKLMEKVLAKRKNVINVFITQALRNKYTSIYNYRVSNCVVLPDAADLTGINFNETLKNKELKCGYIGSFQKGKGVEIVTNIAKRMPEMKFHIIGGKKEEINKLKECFPCSNIVWHGFLTQTQAMKILENDIDIALLPNQKVVLVGDKKNMDIGKYTSPMKLFEYMSYGKAIIASDIDVLKEIIHNNENAIIVSPDNIEEWVEAINYLKDNIDVLNKLGKNALNEFEEKYTWKKRADSILKLVKDNFNENKSNV